MQTSVHVYHVYALIDPQIQLKKNKTRKFTCSQMSTLIGIKYGNVLKVWDSLDETCLKPFYKSTIYSFFISSD